jgi:serine/threonine protein kinase
MALDQDSETQRLGDFEIAREIGRGGMGVVYEARQVSLNRKVALKVLSGGLGLTPKAVQRFHREAEAAAKLHHTNIVPVYATGEEDGTHFYAMELIEGPSLDHVIRQMRMGVAGAERSNAPAGASEALAPAIHRAPALETTGPYVPEAGSASTLSASSLSSDSHYFDTVARIIAEVADALEYAHQQGVIHRDLKPSNLLLSPAGRLSLNDFGLARVLEQPGMTLSGEFVGTPAYMSPEQIAVGRIPLDHRTDIYSLGATLYELLTLEPPFTGKSREQVLAQIVQKEPKSPRRIQKKLQVDLETICLKCLEKDPDRRYQTAGALAEDLRRYVNRFAISAQRAGPVVRLRKWVKRHPGLSAGVSLAVVAILVAGFFAVQSWRERQERIAAEESARKKLITEKKQLAESRLFNGQFLEAETAIAEAEALGVEEEWVQWRLGLIAYHKWETEKSRALLKKAVAKMPENLAAICQLTAQSWPDFISLRDRIASLAPTMAEDYLYLGLVQSQFSDTVKALQTLDEGVKRQPHLIAHVIRANALASHAADTKSLVAIEKAIVDVNAAKSILPGNPYALETSFEVHFSAVGIYKHTGQEARKCEDALKGAWADVEELARSSDLPIAASWRGLLLQYEGKDEEAIDVLAPAVGKERDAVFRYALCLFRRGTRKDIEQATEVLKRSPPEGGERDWLLVIFLAELEGSSQALKHLEKSNESFAMDHKARLWSYFPFLYLLGESDRATREAGNIKALTNQEPWSDLDGDRLLLEYMRNPDPTTEAKLLKASSRSQTLLCHVHCVIGFVLLGKGDRTGARRHFEACVATHQFLNALDINACRVFVERMKKDPDWPPWIKPKKDQPKP